MCKFKIDEVTYSKHSVEQSITTKKDSKQLSIFINRQDGDFPFNNNSCRVYKKLIETP